MRVIGIYGSYDSYSMCGGLQVAANMEYHDRLIALADTNYYIVIMSVTSIIKVSD